MNQLFKTLLSIVVIFLIFFSCKEKLKEKKFNTKELTEIGTKNEGWENYRQMLLKSYPLRDPEINFNHAAKQAYIAFSQAIVAAAFEEVDATPMEGFKASAVDEILDLKAKGRKSCVLLPLGYRDAENDWFVNLKKVRKPKKDLITEVE